MSIDSHLKQKLLTHVIDQAPQKSKQLIKSSQTKRKVQPNCSPKMLKKLSMQPQPTYSIHRKQKQPNQTIRFPSSGKVLNSKSNKFIKTKPRSTTIFQNQQQHQKMQIYTNKNNPSLQPSKQYLHSLGYSYDLRTPHQIYFDKTQQNKSNYMNKMLSLRKDLDSSHSKACKIFRGKIQSKIIGQQLRRKRQRQMVLLQQKKCHTIFISLLNSGLIR